MEQDSSRPEAPMQMAWWGDAEWVWYLGYQIVNNKLQIELHDRLDRPRDAGHPDVKTEFLLYAGPGRVACRVILRTDGHETSYEVSNPDWVFGYPTFEEFHAALSVLPLTDPQWDLLVSIGPRREGLRLDSQALQLVESLAKLIERVDGGAWYRLTDAGQERLAAGRATRCGRQVLTEIPTDA